MSRPYALVTLGAFGLLALQALALFLMGHPAISASGAIEIWHGIVASPENSQQISDWYTFSHVIHGFLFYLLLWVLFPRMPIGWRLLLALGIEASLGGHREYADGYRPLPCPGAR